MAIYNGPNTVASGLILNLDPANIKSTRGEPTTNLATSSILNWDAGTITTVSDYDQYNVLRNLTKLTITSSPGRAYINHTIGVPVANQAYTISMWIKRIGSVNVTAGWEPEVTVADSYARPEQETGFVGNFYQNPNINDIPTQWERVTYTFKYTTQKISSVTLFIYFTGLNGEILFSDIQVEAKSSATNYTATSRTATFFDLSNNSNNATLTDGPKYNPANAGGRRNLLTYTEDLTVFYKYALAVTANTTVSPFGNQVADKIYATTVNDYHFISPGYNVIANTIYTYSVYVKALEYTKVHFAEGYNGTFNCSVDLTNGNIISKGGGGLISAYVEPSIDGWYRISVTFKPYENHPASLAFAGYPNSGATTGTYGVTYTGDGSSGIAVFGIQLEVGSYATTYQRVAADGTFNDTDKAASFVFDGLNDMLRVPSPNNKFAWTPSGVGNNSMSIELWVKTLDNDHIISKPWNGVGQYNYQLFGWGGFYIFSGDASNFGLAGSPVNTGNWEYFCGIITPTQLAIYRNGILNVGFANHGLVTNGPSVNTNDDLCFMAVFPYGVPWVGSTGLAASGNISSVRIYNRVLSAAEILQNYNATRGKFGV